MAGVVDLSGFGYLSAAQQQQLQAVQQAAQALVQANGYWVQLQAASFDPAIVASALTSRTAALSNFQMLVAALT